MTPTIVSTVPERSRTYIFCRSEFFRSRLRSVWSSLLVLELVQTGAIVPVRQFKVNCRGRHLRFPGSLGNRGNDRFRAYLSNKGNHWEPGTGLGSRMREPRTGMETRSREPRTMSRSQDGEPGGTKNQLGDPTTVL